jgi:hypothetical protein
MGRHGAWLRFVVPCMTAGWLLLGFEWVRPVKAILQLWLESSTDGAYDCRSLVGGGCNNSYLPFPDILSRKL